MNNLAIIPARGGSKRIPGKNIKDFLGKPVIAYSIEAAIASGLFDEIMVSTDNDIIAKISKNFGAKVPFMRSPKNSDDHATLADVVDEVKQNYLNAGIEFNYGCCILPTSPMLNALKLQEAFNLIEKSRLDSVRPIVEFSYPIQRALEFKDGKVKMINPEFLITRSQDLEKVYHDAGQFYWFRYEKGLRGTKKGAIVLNSTEVQDIDTVEDWKLAEMKYQMLKK